MCRFLYIHNCTFYFEIYDRGWAVRCVSIEIYDRGWAVRCVSIRALRPSATLFNWSLSVQMFIKCFIKSSRLPIVARYFLISFCLEGSGGDRGPSVHSSPASNSTSESHSGTLASTTFPPLSLSDTRRNGEPRYSDGKLSKDISGKCWNTRKKCLHGQCVWRQSRQSQDGCWCSLVRHVVWETEGLSIVTIKLSSATSRTSQRSFLQNTTNIVEIQTCTHFKTTHCHFKLSHRLTFQIGKTAESKIGRVKIDTVCNMQW